MNKERLTDHLHTVPGGAILYILFLFVGYIPYFPKLNELFAEILASAWVVSFLFILFAVLHRASTVKRCVARIFILWRTFIVLLVVNGSLGIIRYLNDEVLHIVETEANSRAAGLAEIYYLIPMLGFCLFAILCKGVAAMIAQRFVRRKCKFNHIKGLSNG